MAWGPHITGEFLVPKNSHDVSSVGVRDRCRVRVGVGVRARVRVRVRVRRVMVRVRLTRRGPVWCYFLPCFTLTVLVCLLI